MTKSEKRYFKLSASIHGGNKNYMELFDTLVNMQDYSEELLRKRLKGSKLLNNLAVEKNYLYNLLLKSLEMFRSELEAENKVIHGLAQVKMLMEKDLQDQALKRVKKVKDLAIKFELMSYMTAILNLEKLLIYRFGSREDYYRNIDRLQDEINHWNKVNVNYHEYRDLNNELHKLFSYKGRARSEEDIQVYDKLFRNRLLKDEENALSFGAKWCFNSTHLYYMRAVGKYKKAEKYGRRALELCEAHPHMLMEDARYYISAIQNLLLTLMELEWPHEALNLAADVERFMEEKGSQLYVFNKDRIRLITLDARHDAYFYTGEFEKSLVLYKEYHAMVEAETGPKNRGVRMSILYEYLHLHMILQDWKKALYWSNVILNERSIGRKDIYALVLILNLCIHYELGNTMLLAYATVNAYRYLLKKGDKVKTEMAVIEMLKKASKVRNEKQLQTAFEELYSKLKKFQKDPYEKRILEGFFLAEWVESKVRGITYREAIMPRIQKHLKP